MVADNARTPAAANALKYGDLRQLNLLMACLHASMRDGFDITTAAIDELVRIIGMAIGARGSVRE